MNIYSHQILLERSIKMRWAMIFVIFFEKVLCAIINTIGRVAWRHGSRR